MFRSSVNICKIKEQSVSRGLVYTDDFDIERFYSGMYVQRRWQLLYPNHFWQITLTDVLYCMTKTLEYMKSGRY